MQPIRAYLGKNVSDFTVSSTAIRWRWQRPTLCYVEVKWTKNVYIDMDNVISVKKVGFESCCGPFGRWFPQSQSGFSIYSVCHLGSSRWGIEQWIATCPSTDVDNYIREIQLFLRLKSVARPRSLLVFINPFGGRRRAEKIFYQKVFPIFELANILCTVVVTERQGHCKDYLLSEDLSVYDGVISVGGDGLFSELLHGVLYRQRMDSKLPLHAFHTPDSPEVTPRLRGLPTPFSSALHIVLGDNKGLDVLSVHDGTTGAFLRYTVSLLGYGFHGDILEPSENLRWMGPDRYNIAGALGFLRLSAYRGRICFLPSKSSANPLDSTVCDASCKICSDCTTDDRNAPESNAAGTSMTDSTDLLHHSPHVHEPAAEDLIHLDAEGIDVLGDGEQGVREEEEEGSIHSNSDSEASALPKPHGKRKLLKHIRSKSTQVFPQVDNSRECTLKPGWKSVTGSFIAINAFPISCRCGKSPQGPAPSAHLGDGCLDLVIVHKCSHHQFLQYLILMANPRPAASSQHAVSADHLKLPFVEVHRVQAMEFIPVDLNGRPLPVTASGTLSDSVITDRECSNPSDRKVSVWCVDGEIMRQAHVYCRVHRQLIRVFCRGPEDF
nr:unnamed protein product [Spirometra erinaceieuropaei]